MYSTDEPVILENFLRHCAKGSYNNIKVLRFIPNFILQTGSSINKSKDNKPADPNNKPTGISHGKFLEHRKIKKGTLFTINNPDQADRCGCQFFFLLSEDHLDSLANGDYTAIGEIIDGFESIEKLASEITTVSHPSGKPTGKWKQSNWLESIEIHNNPLV